MDTTSFSKLHALSQQSLSNKSVSSNDILIFVMCNVAAESNFIAHMLIEICQHL